MSEQTGAAPSAAGAGWEEYVDSASGQSYYHNPATGDTTWERPAEFRPAAETRSTSTSSEAAAAPEISATDSEQAAVWEEWLDQESDRPYYYNRITQETTWERPQTHAVLAPLARSSSFSSLSLVTGASSSMARPQRESSLTSFAEQSVVGVGGDGAAAGGGDGAAKSSAEIGFDKPEDDFAVLNPDDLEDKRQRQRLRAAKEIVSTENSYVAGLKVLLELYYYPLAQDKSNCGISLMVVQQVFSNIQTIYALNSKLLEDLKERLREWFGKDEAAQCIGDILVQFIPFLKMYKLYCNSYEQAIATVGKLLTDNVRFHAFVEEAEASPQARGLKLSSFLIMPIQRIPRYKLLLSELLKHTEPEHADYKPLEKALDLVSIVASDINEAMHEQTSKHMVLEIQSSFYGDLQLVSPSRVFIRKGMLTKVCRNKDKPYTFFLFNDLLLYALKLVGGKYRLNRMVPIDSSFSVDRKVPVETLPEGAHAIRLMSAQKSFYVYSKEEEINAWFEDIVRCIEESKTKLKTADTSSVGGEVAAVMETGKEECGECHEKFSMIKRKHNCRKCGKLVCGECSRYRQEVQGDKRRVCKSCAISLGININLRTPRSIFSPRTGSDKPSIKPKRTTGGTYSAAQLAELAREATQRRYDMSQVERAAEQMQEVAGVPRMQRSATVTSLSSATHANAMRAATLQHQQAVAARRVSQSSARRPGLADDDDSDDDEEEVAAEEDDTLVAQQGFSRLEDIGSKTELCSFPGCTKEKFPLRHYQYCVTHLNQENRSRGAARGKLPSSRTRPPTLTRPLSSGNSSLSIAAAAAAASSPASATKFSLKKPRDRSESPSTGHGSSPSHRVLPPGMRPRPPVPTVTHPSRGASLGGTSISPSSPTSRTSIDRKEESADGTFPSPPSRTSKSVSEADGAHSAVSASPTATAGTVLGLGARASNVSSPSGARGGPPPLPPAGRKPVLKSFEPMESPRTPTPKSSPPPLPERRYSRELPATDAHAVAEEIAQAADSAGGGGDADSENWQKPLPSSSSSSHSDPVEQGPPQQPPVPFEVPSLPSSLPPLSRTQKPPPPSGPPPAAAIQRGISKATKFQAQARAAASPSGAAPHSRASSTEASTASSSQEASQHDPPDEESVTVSADDLVAHRKRLQG